MATLNFKNPDTGKWEEIGGVTLKKKTYYVSSERLIWTPGTPFKVYTINGDGEHFVPIGITSIEYTYSKGSDNIWDYFITATCNSTGVYEYHIMAVTNNNPSSMATWEFNIEVIGFYVNPANISESN